MEHKLKACFIARRPNHRFPAGFTLTEVMIVVIILGIAAMIGLPALNSALVDNRLTGAASEIVTALEFAQMTAMTTGAKTRVTIDASNDTILVEQFTISGDLLGAETELDESTVESGAFTTMEQPQNRGIDYNINLTDQNLFGSNVDITSAVFGAGNSVTFSTLGAPSTGGTVTLTSGGSQIILTVDSLTGKVTTSG